MTDIMNGIGANKSSTPISLNDARSMHINYLESASDHVLTDLSGQDVVVSSFMLEKDDLDFLMAHAATGVRLYFGKVTPTSKYLHIIAVPVKDNDHNEVRAIIPGTALPHIINTLEPCPTICPPPDSTEDLNCRSKNGDFYWVTRNRVADAAIWHDAAGNVQPKPMPPYEE